MNKDKEPTRDQVLDLIRKIEPLARESYIEWKRNPPMTCDIRIEDDFHFWIVRQCMIELSTRYSTVVDSQSSDDTRDYDYYQSKELSHQNKE